MMLFALVLCSLVLSVGPALLFARNWNLYQPPPRWSPDRVAPSVSILIPARDEEAGIGDAVAAALATLAVRFEVIVLDDHSTDRTAQIVAQLADKDARVSLHTAPPLPEGWCGKQHACHVLSGLASHEMLAFIDADVRLLPDAMARSIAFMDASRADLVSGIPQQETGTFLEKLLIPLIHFVLLSYLPIDRMRRSANPAYGAGCGQFFVARRSAYVRSGGHAAIRKSLHDGITLPRAFRRAGLRTDMFDTTDVATCRMYRTAAQVWRGLEKNATEGMASPLAIVPWTFLLFVGQVLPVAIWVSAILLRRFTPIPLLLCGIAIAVTFAVRIAAAVRFKQSLLGAVLHPAGVMVLLWIQWSALFRKLTGRPSRWRGRDYTVASAERPAEPVVLGS